MSDDPITCTITSSVPATATKMFVEAYVGGELTRFEGDILSGVKLPAGTNIKDIAGVSLDVPHEGLGMLFGPVTFDVNEDQ